jgi:hypothetical protein
VIILGVDPGLNEPGWAVVSDAFSTTRAAAIGSPPLVPGSPEALELIIARRARIPEDWVNIDDPAERIALVADAILAEVAQHGDLAMIDVLAFEWPKIYHNRDSANNSGKVDKNDLIGLAGIGMAIEGRLTWMPGRRSPLRRVAPTPGKWAGNLPKSKKGDAFKSPRGMRLKSRLRGAELAAFGARPNHDALDAACIALFAAGRWAPVRMFHGARS